MIGCGKEICVDAESPMLLPTDPEVMVSEVGQLGHLNYKSLLDVFCLYMFTRCLV